MADSGDLEKKLMRLKKDELKEEARTRNLAESGTKAELVRKFDIFSVKKKKRTCQLSFRFTEILSTA